MRDRRKVVSFLVVGTASAVLGLILLYVFVEWLGLSKNVANFAQLTIILQVNFLLNTKYTWKDIPTTLKEWGNKWTSFHLVHLVGLWVNLVVYGILIVWLPYILSSGITMLLVATLNYLGMDRFVFKRG